jgi:hypothetical protein
MINFDLCEDILTTIEEEYGAKIQRVINLQDYGDYFTFCIIFSDYRLLEASVKIRRFLDDATVKIEGKIY